MNIKLNKKRTITRKICGQDVKITPYIDSTKKQLIMNKMLEYFNESNTNDIDYSRVICELRANYDVLVLEMNTDIEVDKEDSYEDMVSSGLVNELRQSIINYDEVYFDTMLVVSTMKMSKLIPSVESFDGMFKTLANELENMSPDQKSNLDTFVKAAMANSTNSMLLKSLKGE